MAPMASMASMALKLEPAAKWISRGHQSTAESINGRRRLRNPLAWLLSSADIHFAGHLVCLLSASRESLFVRALVCSPSRLAGWLAAPRAFKVGLIGRLSAKSRPPKVARRRLLVGPKQLLAGGQSSLAARFVAELAGSSLPKRLIESAQVQLAHESWPLLASLDLRHVGSLCSLGRLRKRAGPPRYRRPLIN